MLTTISSPRGGYPASGTVGRPGVHDVGGQARGAANREQPDPPIRQPLTTGCPAGTHQSGDIGLQAQSHRRVRFVQYGTVGAVL